MKIFFINKVIKTSSILALLVFLLSFSITSNKAGHISPNEKLSAYGFFDGDLKQLQPAMNVFPYELNSTLFSNYAEKLRFVYMPAGKQVAYKEKGVLDFPEGTFLIKNFYYLSDSRHPEKGRRIIETRLLVHGPEGWEAWPYYWNDEQTEAYYDVGGERTEVNYINNNGKKIKTAYYVPNKNECKGCHSYNQQMLPVGPSVSELNREMNYAGGSKNQLLHWKENNLINDLPALNAIPKMPVWDDVKTGSLNERARAYLDINCANCHRRGGPAETSGLLLNYDERNATATGIYKSPVATGKGSAGRLFDIVPRKPNESILLHRMQTNDPGEAMPELGREQVHREAVELIYAWIKNMSEPVK
ncbi:MAG: SO2930 family diheme c-type cytochrome [Ferruginibacter sp.]